MTVAVLASLQDPGDTTFEALAKRHVPAASQPARPHGFCAVSSGQLSGSGAFTTGAQLPSLPHAWQGPHAACWQQRPSTQACEEHVAADWQGAPLSPRARHAPLATSQKLFAAQSPSFVQAVQAPLAHGVVGQLNVVAGAQ